MRRYYEPKMNSRTLAIGDVHGCLAALDTLLGFVELRPDDELIFLGDYIDRGPDSRGVIERVIELCAHQKLVALRGNHEAWLLRAQFEPSWFGSWQGVGGEETLASYDAFSVDDLPDAHLEFLNNTRLFHQNESHIFVHAAISARAPHENREEQLLWGKFNQIKPHPSGKRVICGHSAQRGGSPNDAGHAVCIETFCYGGGWLSALDVVSNRVWQANQAGATRLIEL